MDRLHFLTVRFMETLRTIDPHETPRFGKMNVQQMIEHMTDSIQIATEKIVPVFEQAEEVTAKMKAFMMSEKPFKDNTPNPLMPDQPLPVRFSSVQESLQELDMSYKILYIILKINPARWSEIHFLES